MTDQVLDARLCLLLSELKLPTMRKIYGKIATEVSQSGGDFRSFLQALLEEELKERRTRRIHRRTKGSSIPPDQASLRDRREIAA